MPAMTAEPDQYLIDHARRVAAQSPCRSKRGVVIYDPSTGAFRGTGHNGPPAPLTCPGRAICAGTCGQRSVHAEVRALRAAEQALGHHPDGLYALVHVELAADGGIVACKGPRCWQCSREILDVGFVGGVWLYEIAKTPPRCGVYLGDNDATCPQLTCIRWRDHGGGHDNVTDDPEPVPVWRYYAAADFHHVTLANCGIMS